MYKRTKFNWIGFIFIFILCGIPWGQRLLFADSRTGLNTETNGFFIGITENQYHFEKGGNANGLGWQAGIIQKTERRPYGFLTGLLYFDYIKAEGLNLEKGDVQFIVNDVVFSLWLSMLFRENQTIAPVISLGPGFVFKIRSQVKNNDLVYKYNSAMFDLKGQVAVGAYIRIDRNLYLFPQFMFGFNLLNNNYFTENWGVDRELNYGLQIGILYSTNY
jgi:hypothetical protein